MTIEEVKEQLDKGEYLTHRFFDEHEYIRKIDGVLVDENEYVMKPEFWEDRKSEQWKDCWSIYEY